MAAIIADTLPTTIATGSTTSLSAALPLSGGGRGGGLAGEGGDGRDGGEGSLNWQRQTAISLQARLAHKPFFWITAHDVPAATTGCPLAQLV
eukprot:scaffold25032_cov52-Phaeocystis_antarctica.AAC.1